MSSRVLSRFLPVAEGDVSVIEGLRRDAARQSDLESQQPTTYNEAFHDEDDNPEAFLYDATQDTSTDPGQSPEMLALPAARHSRPRAEASNSKRTAEEDDDVPESLLLESKSKRQSSRPATGASRMENKLARADAQWKAMQEQQGLHRSPAARATRPTTRHSSRPSQPPAATPTPVPGTRTDPQTEALWLYTNATNLDAFLLEVYDYYVGHGVWSIMLSRVLSLATELFVFSFAMFLTTCIEYSKIPTSKTTSEVMIPKCMSKASWLKSAALFFFIVYWLSQIMRYIGETRRLFRMHNFFHHVLGISDDDIQTESWVRVVDGLIRVQNANIATANPSAQVRKYLDYKEPQQRLSAESISNRLMRQANYYVAFYNKDIFDFTLPLPFIGDRQFYSKSLEWCIDFCFTNFIFDEQGSIRPFCLDVKNRSALVEALRTRLRFAAVTSVIVAPFNILRFCIMYFFRYYTEFTKNPSRASSRTFTPYAEWKIREFNELEHLFRRRLRQAHPFANDYLKQFPKDKMDQISRFIAFVSGAIAAVLTLGTLIDSEMFLAFEVTPGRTAFFWIAVTGAIFAFAHGSVPDENEVHDPVLHLKEVLMYVHYQPKHWKDRLHSNEVRAEFSAMFQMRPLIFVEEILSLIVAPWLLWRNSGKRCERIIDFFREQTVHVEGVGYQCNFAVFNFKKDPNADDATAVLNEPDGLRDDYYAVKDDKMAQSVQNFAQYYLHYRQTSRRPGWQPPPMWPPVMSPPSIAEEPGPTSASARPSPPSARKSALLDPRQRPSSSMLRSPRQTGLNAPRRGVAQRSDESGRRTATVQGVSESRLMAQDSDLQDFADAPGAKQLESDTDQDENEDAKDGVNTGVLGMLAQLSKAHAEKGPGPVNI